ncbi:helix-turn-helix transcriptional regulator [Macrococcus caseolyticus]|uniref:helix-turn-helix domain-containing protein n=1 Tax=Macrococcoides caseolyticum TaxID=69966 RepID=UPI0024BC72FC|nr:helix-turn-helix transcriptional regulator [Macrococcus caseolyticus]MDJ1110492.1 helix-turn-helix transcriptional regulator [Macrococcus caseolyticus]
MKIGEVLKKIRQIYSRTAKDLAKDLNISPSYLSEIENNKKDPSLDLIEKYSDIFDIKVSSIILMAEDMNDNRKISMSEKFIQKRMIKLLNKYAVERVDNNEETIT